MAKGRHIHRRRRAAVLIALAVVAGVALLVFGGAAFAAIRYEHTHADKIITPKQPGWMEEVDRAIEVHPSSAGGSMSAG